MVKVWEAGLCKPKAFLSLPTRPKPVGYRSNSLPIKLTEQQPKGEAQRPIGILCGSRGPFKTLHTTTLPALRDQPYPQNGDLSKQPIGKMNVLALLMNRLDEDAFQNVMQSRQTVDRLSCLKCGQVERRRLPSSSI